MAAITVEQKVFERLKQAYTEKFGGSPKLLINELNRIYQEKTDNTKDVISDKTIRNFFKDTEPMKMLEKNLNFLCRVLLGYESYQEVLRQQVILEKVEQINPEVNEWLDRYREYISTKCGTMKVLTMTRPVELDSIYAKVNVLEIIKGRKQKTIEELLANITSDNISFSRLNYKVSDRNVGALDVVKRYQKLIIWGKPGAGKTTFLKHLSIHSAQELGKQVVPIFISLKAFADEENKPNLIDVIIREFMTCTPEPEQLVQELLEQGSCLILLDGLDEVVNAESDRIYRNINTFLEQYAKNRFVMTCRSGASDYTFDYFTEVEMADFDENQVLMFVKKWFASSEEQNLGDRFIEELERNKSIKELTTSPLLLTMLCLVFEDNYEFPKNQYSLTEDAVNILLRKWDASRRIDRNSVNKFNLPYQRKVNMLSQIAYEAFNQEPQKYFWQPRELEELIHNYIENIPEIAPETLTFASIVVLETIEANHGLLVKQAKDLYSFSHLTFQEYFVANYIVESRNHETLNVVIKQHLTNRQWREVFLMIAVRLANADEFLKLMFHQINILVESDALQKMLTWLDDVTTLYAVKSSSWRAYYLWVDQQFELYTNLLTKSDSTLAERLAVMLKEFNKEQGKIIKRSQLSDFALLLVDVYTKVSDKAYDNKFDTSKVSPLLRKELPVSDDSVIIPQLLSGVTIDKEKGVITINKQKGQMIDKERFPIQASYMSDSIEDQADIGEEDIIARARQLKYDDLADELIYVQDCFPADEAPKWEWQEWANKLRGLMMLYLNIGYNDVKFSHQQIKTLEDYFYANILLLECIRAGSYSSKELRNQIIDHLLLPYNRIPPELLP
ncbi:NACHT domain-containing protein [Iningainema tapete]|uniref:NACHT domain-containing protein n=1 Tax=Iningainema tapete BLCC-T55 TaxID=2748662 RepID=A0A8J7C7P8_9CYAN|nr:NACHT domain-containing protein [Iningainema tapete]MBD2775964.1 NACHT domain-containing protein [Iningainema tapete BLCC-T55]